MFIKTNVWIHVWSITYSRRITYQNIRRMTIYRLFLRFLEKPESSEEGVRESLALNVCVCGVRVPVPNVLPMPMPNASV